MSIVKEPRAFSNLSSMLTTHLAISYFALNFLKVLGAMPLIILFMWINKFVY